MHLQVTVYPYEQWLSKLWLLYFVSCQLKQQQKTFNDSVCYVVTGLQWFCHLWLLHHTGVKYKCLLHYFTKWKPNFTNIAFKCGKYFRGFQGKHSWADTLVEQCMTWLINPDLLLFLCFLWRLFFATHVFHAMLLHSEIII